MHLALCLHVVVRCAVCSEETMPRSQSAPHRGHATSQSLKLRVTMNASEHPPPPFALFADVECSKRAGEHCTDDHRLTRSVDRRRDDPFRTARRRGSARKSGSGARMYHACACVSVCACGVAQQVHRCRVLRTVMHSEMKYMKGKS